MCAGVIGLGIIRRHEGINSHVERQSIRWRIMLLALNNNGWRTLDASAELPTLLCNARCSSLAKLIKNIPGFVEFAMVAGKFYLFGVIDILPYMVNQRQNTQVIQVLEFLYQATLE